jgi:hypothetical protein
MAPLLIDDVAPVMAMEIDKVDSDYYSSSDHGFNNSKICFGPLHLRRVSFGSIATVHDVLHRVDYTLEEVNSAWYDRVELRMMKEATKIEARLLDKGLIKDDENVTIRGLEGRTRFGAQRKRTNKINAYIAVFMEMEAQFELGICDGEAIADVYYENSEKCQAEAHMLGARDALDVQNAT